jgi:NAD(P)H-flavin reductase
MPPKKYNLTIADSKKLAENIYLISFMPSEKIDFHAGQYFSFKIADKVNRSYSIASTPSDKHLEFLIEAIPGGVGSNHLVSLLPRDSIESLGPLGFFTLEKTGALNDEEELIFVATGSGIAPIRSMVRDLLLGKKSQRKISLYFGLRFDNEAYLFEEFEKLANEYENFEFTPVISRPTPNWSGVVGHCQDCILKNPINPNARIYICGGNESVEGISTDLINAGYQKDRVFFEKFG